MFSLDGRSDLLGALLVHIRCRYCLLLLCYISFTIPFQDSLSFCATLQDADRNRQENIMDFMEREMNLDEYIGALKVGLHFIFF